MEDPPTRWANATRQILVLGRQAPCKFSRASGETPASHSLSLFLLSFSSTVLFLSFVVFSVFCILLVGLLFFSFLCFFLSHSVLLIFSLTRPLRRHVTLCTDFAERREEGKGVRGKAGQWIKRDSRVLTKD